MTMRNELFFTAGNSPALHRAVQELKNLGVGFADAPCDRVTHLLLPVPCQVKPQELETILKLLPQTVTVVGGNLNAPELQRYDCMDLLTDERYQAENAMITADCALKLAGTSLRIVWQDCPVLILGWGRIGKCLAKLLGALGSTVSVAARKEADRAMITALGYDAQNIEQLGCILRRYRVIFNTVPCPILTKAQTAHCRTDCVLVELASKPGMEAETILDGRRLPGRLAPESSGKLIARTVLRLCAQKEAAL